MTSSNRIIGGQKAKKPIPWQVSVRDCNNGNCHTCGGTILDNLTILTAAHCFKKGQSLSKISIMAGHKNRKAKKNNQVCNFKKSPKTTQYFSSISFIYFSD